MTENPEYEDAMTIGLTALADAITRSIDLVLPGGVLRLVGINWSRRPSLPPTRRDEAAYPGDAPSA